MKEGLKTVDAGCREETIHVRRRLTGGTAGNRMFRDVSDNTGDGYPVHVDLVRFRTRCTDCSV